MKRKASEPVFKPYVMGQIALLPPSLDEMISENHLVRKVNEAVEQIDISPLMNQYKGGGTSSYHPKMMLKIMIYAYAERIYSSRQIAKALRENIQFMWISGGNTPDFRTINDFRGNRLKGVIEEVFSLVLEYLLETGHVKLENYFLDGTKIEANANKYKAVWGTQREHYHKRVQEQIKELLKQIDEVNQAEQEEYGDEDLEELGENSQEDINSERLKKKIEELNQKLRKKTESGKKSGSERKAIRKLEKDCLVRLEKYEEQEKILDGRNNYSKTDEDASFMRMKEDQSSEKPAPKPGYNVQIGTEDQFITGFSVHNCAGDTTCLIPHLEKLQSLTGRLPQNVIADAGYGSEENYAWLDKHETGNYVKYNTFYQDTHKFRNPDIPRSHQFRGENFGYDDKKDEFICPANQRLHFLKETPYITDNGYPTTRRIYEGDQCNQCSLKPQCTRAKDNRQIQISFRLLDYRRKARANLTSEKGVSLRKKRSTDVESVFGLIKQNMGFRRFHLRGLEKVIAEWGVVSIAYNMRKLAAC